jgi:hypothetical protein
MLYRPSITDESAKRKSERSDGLRGEQRREQVEIVRRDQGDVVLSNRKILEDPDGLIGVHTQNRLVSWRLCSM